MATNASIGYGSKYAIYDDDTAEFVELGEVVSIEGGSDDTDLVDVTHMQSPDRRREYIGGLIDGGEITVELNFVANDFTHKLLREQQIAGTPSEHKVTFPRGETLTVEAIVTSVSWNDPIDDKMSLSFTAKKSGAETWANGGGG